MRRVFLFALSGLAVCALLSTAVLAGGHNPGDYPLRVHIYQFNGHSHYAHRTVDYVDGEGRANLFENGQPRGFDFKYRCSERLRNSAGFETYPARWRKQGKQLEILLPQFGKTDSFDSCDLDVLMKSDTVYHRHNGSLLEEPTATYKEWMDKHQYDPEHGKNEPVGEAPETASGQKPTGNGANAPR